MQDKWKVVFLNTVSAVSLLGSLVPEAYAQQGIAIGACSSAVCPALGPSGAGTASPVTPSNLAVGAGNFTTSQTTIATTAVLISATRSGIAGTGRIALTICNSSTVNVYLGGSGVSTTNGSLLVGIAGACMTLNTQTAVYGIVTSGTTSVTAAETY